MTTNLVDYIADRLLVLTIVVSCFMCQWMIVDNYSVEKILAVLVIAVGAMAIVIRGDMYQIPGVIPLLIFGIIPVLIHGYVNMGVIYGILIYMVVANKSLSIHEEATLSRYLVVALGGLLAWVVIEIILTGNIIVLRESEFALKLTKYTALDNPNLFSRTAIMLLPLLLLYGAQKTISRRVVLVVTSLTVATIIFVALSRANTLAIVVMAYIALRYGHRKRSISLSSTAFVLLAVVLVSVVLATNSHVHERLNSMSRIVEATMYSIEKQEVESGPSRSKIWAASALLISESPFLGVGQEGGALINERGAVKIKAGEIHNLAVHGGLLRVTISTGLLGLALFLAALLSLTSYFFRMMRNGVVAGKYGLMFLAGTFVSQIGADVYAMPLFWIMLGLHLASIRLELQKRGPELSNVLP